MLPFPIDFTFCIKIIGTHFATRWNCLYAVLASVLQIKLRYSVIVEFKYANGALVSHLLVVEQATVLEDAVATPP